LTLAPSLTKFVVEPTCLTLSSTACVESTMAGDILDCGYILEKGVTFERESSLKVLVIRLVSPYGGIIRPPRPKSYFICQCQDCWRDRTDSNAK
jgi:hypothetical protein